MTPAYISIEEFDTPGEVSAQLACASNTACVGNDVPGPNVDPMDDHNHKKDCVVLFSEMYRVFE